MSATNEEYMNRRKIWALMPSKYHKGEELCIHKTEGYDYKFSFFGQGATLVVAHFPENKWEVIEKRNGNVVWSINDTTEILSEFYGLDVCILDTIYEIQCNTNHERKQLVDILMNAPVCTVG